MSAERKTLLEVKTLLEDCAKKLSQCRVPSSIGSHVQLALERLTDQISMLDRWDRGSAWEDDSP